MPSTVLLTASTGVRSWSASGSASRATSESVGPITATTPSSSMSSRMASRPTVGSDSSSRTTSSIGWPSTPPAAFAWSAAKAVASICWRP